MDDQLFDKMKKLIADRLEIDEGKITLESSFRQDLGADSLDTYELVYAIEEELGITIPDEKANEFETVQGRSRLHRVSGRQQVARRPPACRSVRRRRSPPPLRSLAGGLERCPSYVVARVAWRSSSARGSIVPAAPSCDTWSAGRESAFAR